MWAGWSRSPRLEGPIDLLSEINATDFPVYTRSSHGMRYQSSKVRPKGLSEQLGLLPLMISQTPVLPWLGTPWLCLWAVWHAWGPEQTYQRSKPRADHWQGLLLLPLCFQLLLSTSHGAMVRTVTKNRQDLGLANSPLPSPS